MWLQSPGRPSSRGRSTRRLYGLEIHAASLRASFCGVMSGVRGMMDASGAPGSSTDSARLRLFGRMSERGAAWEGAGIGPIGWRSGGAAVDRLRESRVQAERDRFESS